MSISPVLLYLFFGMLVLVSFIVLWVISSRYKSIAHDALKDKNDLKILYDQLRKDKYDLDEKINQIQEQERTYKVAYEDWKSKYSLLEEKYLEIKRNPNEVNIIQDLETTKEKLAISILLNQELSEKVSDLEQRIALTKENQKTPETNSGDSKIVSDLKSILDQHLLIISNIIGDEKMEQYTLKAQASDPLHLIKGIDEYVETRLLSKGIRSFDQIKNTSKKEVKKWMVEFDEVDDKLIESWPFQAEAIINTQALLTENKI